MTSLETGRDVTDEELGALSTLHGAGLDEFRSRWERLSEARRAAAITTLGERERHHARLDFVSIYALALADPSPDVRGGAAAAIEEDQNAVLLEQLVNLLTEDPDASVRRNAATALARYAYRAEVGELPESALQRTRAALLSALRSEAEPSDVRAAALGSVGYFSDAEVRGELRVRYDNAQTRLGALRGMGHSADPRWLDVILATFNDDEADAREEAARAAGEIEDERALAALADLVDDPSTDVRLAALRSLGQIGGEEAREALIYALGDGSPLIRGAAERALEAVGDDPLA